MSDKLVTSIVTILIAVVGVAALAVLLSPSAKSASVLQAGGSTFASLLSCAESPLNGSGAFGVGACGFGSSSTVTFG
jgi:hypothetical protein